MHARYEISVVHDDFWPGELIVLEDRETQSWAKVVPAQGCSLVSFGATRHGQAIETMLQPSDETPSKHPSQYGAPVLFPFPNRLRDGHARFSGRSIQIDRAPGQRHAIHGLVSRLPWQIDHQAVDASGAHLTCSIETTADILRQFPFPYRLTLRFHLSDARARIEIEAENRGDSSDSPMPFGFGWHPYFRLPLLAGTPRSGAIVRVPARRQWVLDETLVPTGETVPVPADRDFRTPRPLGAINLDDVYTDLLLDDGQSSGTLTDPASGTTLRVSAGPTFREWVIYAPPTRPTICFEPYTCPTDAFNLAQRGLAVGVITLAPGERWSDWLELGIESHPESSELAQSPIARM